MLKKIYEIFGFIVLTKQIFTFQIPFFSAPFLGRDVNTYLLYFLISSSLFFWVAKLIRKNKVSLRDFGLLIYLFISAVVTLGFSWHINNVLSDAIMFMMPIVVYAWYNVCKPKLDTYIKILLFTSILSGTLSILISIGTIDVKIWAANGDLVRAAGAISSTFGVGAFIITMCMLFLMDNSWTRKNRWLIYLALIGSIVTVLLSFSRTRWVICACVAILVSLMALKNVKKSGYGIVRLVAFFSILIAMTIVYQPDIIEKIFSQMMIRFDNVQANDHSITYRFLESNVQIAIFASYFIMGAGWGVLSTYGMYIHNLYTALPAQSGMFSIFYFLWLLSFLIKAIRNKMGHDLRIIMSLILQGVLLVLNATNGGIIVSGGYFMLIFVYIVDDMIRNDRLNKNEGSVFAT